MAERERFCKSSRFINFQEKAQEENDINFTVTKFTSFVRYNMNNSGLSEITLRLNEISSPSHLLEHS